MDSQEWSLLLSECVVRVGEVNCDTNGVINIPVDLASWVHCEINNEGLANSEGDVFAKSLFWWNFGQG
jgi:hypothetical protein